MEIMKYKNYEGSAEISSEDRILYGKILFINDLILYEGENFTELEVDFHRAVDEYIEFCLENSKEADKPCSGTFNVRINPELHKKLALQALSRDCSINACVGEAIENFVKVTPSIQHQAVTDLMKVSSNLCDSVSKLYSFNKIKLSVVTEPTALGIMQPLEITSSITKH